MKKRKDGRYQKAITISGKKTFFYGNTVAEVNKKILEYNSKVSTGRKFEEVIDDWYYSIEPDLSPTSIRSYKPAKVEAVSELGKTYIKELTANDIHNYILRLAKKKYAQKTIATRLQVVRQALNYAICNGELQYNVANGLKLPKNLAKSERIPPPPIDIEKIKNSYNDTFSLIYVIALYTGCRRGEILALQWEDIDYKNDEISITKSVYHIANAPFVKTPKTKNSVRSVPLLPQLALILQKEQIKTKAKSGYIFSNDDGTLYSYRHILNAIKKYKKNNNIDVTPHQLRHAYATRIYELGIDDKSAQGLLGHADIQTTKNIYTHISDEKRKMTAEKLKDF